MAEKLSWGIMGTGGSADNFAISLKKSVYGELIAVGSRSENTAREFAIKHHLSRSYSSYRALAADSEVDAIFVSTPPTVHRECVITAAFSGKHVLCEKPLGINPLECREMIAIANRRGVLLLEAMEYRTHPQTIRIEEVLEEGTIGEIRTVRSSFTYGLDDSSNAINVKLDKKLRGGGLYDIGCYCLQFSRMVIGEEPNKFEATWNIGETTGVDENLAVVMQFPSGALAHFDVGIQSVPYSFAEILGTSGRIFIPNPWVPDPVKASFKIITADGEKSEVIEDGGDVYTLEADHLAAVLAREVEPLNPPENSIGNAVILDALWKRMHG